MAESLSAVPELTRDTALLRSFKSYDDVLAYFSEEKISVVDSAEFGDGFELIKDKSELVGVPFVIVGLRFADSEYGEDPFAILHVMTVDGRKRIFVDGSTGIRDQAVDIAKNSTTGGVGVRCKTGLTRSDYLYIGVDRETGEEIRKPSTTFYLS